MGNKKKSEKYKEEKNILEYIVFYSSLALVLGLLAYLSYSVVTVKNTDPKLEITYKLKPQPKSPYLYQIFVKNASSNTAEDVIIELVQEESDKTIEKGELKIMFVSGKSSVDGWINFSKNPFLADTVYARVVSYKSS